LNKLEDKNIKSFVKAARKLLKSCNPKVDVPAFEKKRKK